MNQTTVQIAQQARGAALPFGPLEDLMHDDSIEEIWFNRPNEIWFATGFGVHRLLVDFSDADQARVLERMLRASGRRLDRTRPFVDATLAEGSRLHAVIPDITREHISVNIRKFKAQNIQLSGLLAAGVIEQSVFDLIEKAIAKGGTILISGATQSGKTTLLSAILNSMPSGERIISVEDTFEIRCEAIDWVAMQTRDAATDLADVVDLRRLIRESLRMRPTRLVVGEVRGAEALDLLIALNSGIPAYCTIHANSAEQALEKLVTLPMMAAENVSSEFARQVFTKSVSLVLFCENTVAGRRVTQWFQP
jgi:pilus assembly protein CpaF